MRTSSWKPLLRYYFDKARSLPLCAFLALRGRWSRQPIAGGAGPVVSLTSFGPRIGSAHLAIESIARGSLRPARIILWLHDAEICRNPPPALRRLQRRGLEIRCTSDYGPHKNYFPYLQQFAHLELPLVVADDDLLYPRPWLRQLHQAYMRDPHLLNCLYAHDFQFSGSDFQTYSAWPFCTSTRPSHAILQGNGGGVVISPTLQKALLQAGDEFLRVSPRSNSIWFHLQALRAGIPVRQIHPRPLRLLYIPGTQRHGLALENRNNGDGYDRQLRAAYTPGERDFLRRESRALEKISQ